MMTLYWRLHCIIASFHCDSEPWNMLWVIEPVIRLCILIENFTRRYEMSFPSLRMTCLETVSVKIKQLAWENCTYLFI